ncbi:unnamed protein product [Rotaria sp. Silwood2]|nr:unnamed protein product [Rotaria sp. Silwood2]CAF4631162.1 unnamed protein product [Rotaria sp. Silwood2]
MSSLSSYPIPSSSLHTMNNHHHHHHHHNNNNNHHYGGDGTNTNYSLVTHQLSENSNNLPNESSSSSSCIVQTPILDYYGQHSYNQTTNRTTTLQHYSHQNAHIYQDNTNNLYRYNCIPSSSSTSSSSSSNIQPSSCVVYPCTSNGSNVNYNQQNILSSCSNLVTQSDMINRINPMNIDLYGLSMSPPQGSSSILANGSSLSSPRSSSIDHPINNKINSNEILPISTSIDSISSSSSSSLTKQQNHPIIYPWMRKVHINNPGNIFQILLLF